MDDLAALLTHRRQRDERSVGNEAGFLGEFAPGGGGKVAVRPDQALGDRPGALVLARPIRPARMPEQHFEVGLAAKHEEPRADLALSRHGGELSPLITIRLRHDPGSRWRVPAVVL